MTKVPLIIAYTNLLHEHRSPEAPEVIHFVAKHAGDEVLMRRIKVMNKLWQLRDKI